MLRHNYSLWLLLILALLTSCGATPYPDSGSTPTLTHPAPHTPTGVTYYVAPAEVEATARAHHTRAEFFPAMRYALMLDTGWQAMARRILD